MRPIHFAAFATAATISIVSGDGARADTGPNITGPITQGNLSIYFIHGPSAPGPAPLTLQEALSKGSVRVVETGSVNELKIENTGDEDVFIQSGDIVKGGRQDRVLTVSFILPKKSGEVPVASFCVEHGRWSARGSEDATKFSSSYNSLPSREAKLAMKAPVTAMASDPAAAAGARAGTMYETSERQAKVWYEVAKTQERLASGVNAAVASPVSATSLELTLENEKLAAARAEAIKALEGQASADDIVGFAFAINGRINSADIYPSNALFRKMWMKLLTAAVTEAVSEKTAAATAQLEPPSPEAMRAFLASAEKGKSNPQVIGGLAFQDVRDAEATLFVQASSPTGLWVHRNYLAK